jgi:subtilisin-like proprotein convertase family protein
MKKTLMTLMIAMVGLWAQASYIPLTSIYQTPAFSGGTIADGNPVGQTFYGNFTAAQSWDRVVAAAVTVDITGGYNGDLYAYLVAPNGTVMVLLDPVNNPNANLTGSGMQATFTGFQMDSQTAFHITSDGNPGGAQLTPGYSAPNDGGGTLTGYANAIGSMLYGPGYNPANDLTAAQYASLPTANGTWSLFIADIMTDDTGNGNHQLNSWSLTLAVVPEPVDLALGLFAVMLLALAGVRRCWQPPTTVANDKMTDGKTTVQ